MFIGGLFGSVFGIFSAFASLLGVSEDWVNKIARKYEKYRFTRKVMNKRSALKNNFTISNYKSPINIISKVAPSTAEDLS